MRNFPSPSKQRGVALFVGLILLVILLLVVLAGSSNTLLQQKMTGYLGESTISFQAAENVLRQIEQELARAGSTGVVPNLQVEDWDATGMERLDCSGLGIRTNPNFDSAEWNRIGGALVAPPGANELRYRVIQMSSVSGANLPCVLLDDVGSTGVFRSSYYFIAVRSLGPAGTVANPRGEQVVFSTFYFEV